MSNITRTPEQEENEQIRVSQEIEESILTNATIDIHDSLRIEALIASIKVGEFKKVGGFYNITAYKDNKIELICFGYKYVVIIEREFTNETNNDDKFEHDFRVAVENNPRTTITYFIDSEIGRLNDIKEVIIKCFGTDPGKEYLKFEQYISMCNYLKFLNEYEGSEILNDSDSEPTKTDLICNKKLLQKLHSDFDGIRWETVELETFLDYMRVQPIGQITVIGGNKDLAIWLRENIEQKRDAVLVPNMGKWFKKLIGKNINYSTFFQ